MTRTLDATRRCSTFRARPIVWLRLPRSHCIPESIIFLHGYCASTCQGDSRIGRNLCWLDCTPRKLETVACTTQCLHSRLHSFSRTSESTNVCLFVCLFNDRLVQESISSASEWRRQMVVGTIGTRTCF